jgi:penicillin-binding protein 1A
MSDDRGLIRRATRVDPPNVIEFPRTGAPPPEPPDAWVDDPRWDDDDGGEPPESSPPKPKLKWLRVVLILLGLGVLALISFVFGMIVSVSRDLPQLENRSEFKHAKNSVLLDLHGKPIGLLSRQNRILVNANQISPAMKHAIIAIEDKRFYSNEGFDIQGVARAVVADVFGSGPTQGGSTITQQFVKNALRAQGNRTIFEKMREAALAYHLTRKWSKQKILTEYLNSVYFGNGAYGVEQAARTYFYNYANDPCTQPGAARTCASLVTPIQGATIAGMVASPSGYDPLEHPRTAKRRRNLVLRNMAEQHYIPASYYQQHRNDSMPTAATVKLPREKSQAPYFTDWVRQQVINRFGAQRALEGGLKIHTTIDIPLQQAAQEVIQEHLSGIGPSAALVAIDNRTGEVRAMAQGPVPDDLSNPNAVDEAYDKTPFNLSSESQRQPGSSFKPFVLAEALKQGVSPDSVWASRKKVFTVPHTHGEEKFVVSNFDNNYAGESTLARALTFSDNSVFAEVGIKVGTPKVARLARKMGIRTPVSHNYAISLGGLKQGVSPLDMAHAYETFARNGKATTGTLGAAKRGPVGITEVDGSNGKPIVRNRRKQRRVLSNDVAQTATSIMETVVSEGTAKNAELDGFAAGKTGTTENFGDAWFIGFDTHYTVAVWVGYPNGIKPMRTEYGGSPVEGGTYPADIWHDFMEQARGIFVQRHPNADLTKAPGEPPSYDGSGNGDFGTGVGSGDTSGAGTGDTGVGSGDTGGGDTGSGDTGGGGGTGDTGGGGTGDTGGGGGDTGAGATGGGGDTGAGATGGGGGGDTGGGGGGTAGGTGAG